MQRKIEHVRQLAWSGGANRLLLATRWTRTPRQLRRGPSARGRRSAAASGPARPSAEVTNQRAWSGFCSQGLEIAAWIVHARASGPRPRASLGDADARCNCKPQPQQDARSSGLALPLAACGCIPTCTQLAQARRACAARCGLRLRLAHGSPGASPLFRGCQFLCLRLRLAVAACVRAARARTTSRCGLRLAAAACVRPARRLLYHACGCGLRLRLASGPPEPARARVSACGLRLQLASAAPDAAPVDSRRLRLRHASTRHSRCKAPATAIHGLPLRQ